jgi:hypothetical protein
VRGGRGGSRGGRGGFRGGRDANGLPSDIAAEHSTSAWGSTSGEAPSSEVAVTTEDAWPVAQEETSAPKTSNNEEFAASAGWGDAPTKAETDAALESAGGWGDAPSAIGDVPPVPKKAATTIPKGAKLSWAQIAKYVSYLFPR